MQNYRENRLYADSLEKQQKIMRKLSKHGIKKHAKLMSQNKLCADTLVKRKRIKNYRNNA